MEKILIQKWFHSIGKSINKLRNALKNTKSAISNLYKISNHHMLQGEQCSKL